MQKANIGTAPTLKPQSHLAVVACSSSLTDPTGFESRKRRLTAHRAPGDIVTALPQRFPVGAPLWYRHFEAAGQYRDLRVAVSDYDIRTGRHLVTSDELPGLTFHASIDRLQVRRANEKAPSQPWPQSPLVTSLEQREGRR